MNTSKARRTRFAALIFALGLFGAGIMSGCATSVSRDYLFNRLQEGAAPLIVDVRTQGEYDRDHVPGAMRIPFSSLGAGLERIGISKNEPIVLYCEHGPRAGFGALSLLLSGYENVYSLEGHMSGWRKSSLPLETSEPGRKAVPQESMPPDAR